MEFIAGFLNVDLVQTGKVDRLGLTNLRSGSLNLSEILGDELVCFDMAGGPIVKSEGAFSEATN
jgi:hypothetical protein